MKSRLIASSLTALMIAAAPAAVIGIAWTPAPAQADTASVPLNKVIGAKAVDANNDTVGDVVGVIVTGNGNIQSLIVDVGSWISGKKDVQVPYSGVTQNKDGNLVVPLTKDQAKSMAAYSYSDPGLRGKVLSDTGTVYQSSSAADATTTAADSTSTTASDTSAANHDGVMNADGSMNSSEVVGLKVENGNKDNVGKIGELLIGKNGRVDGVVVDVGGFLGMGTHPVRLDWKTLKFMERDGSTVALIDASKDSLKAMPEYKTSSM